MKTKNEIKLRKAYKSVVILTPETQTRLRIISEAMINLWNLAIDQAQVWLETKKRAITAFSFNYWLTEIRKNSTVVSLKDGTEVSLGEISSDVERETLRKLAGSFQSFFGLKKKNDARAKMPWKRDLDRFHTLSWSSFSVENGILCVPEFKGRHLEIPIGEYLKDRVAGKDVVHVTIAFYEGQWELSIVTASTMPPITESPTFYRAIDIGAGNVAITDSDGSEFMIPTRRPDKHWRRIAKSIESRLENRTRGSRGYKRLMQARRHVWNKSMDQHTSHQRKLAHAIVESKVSCVVIGKPKTRLGLSQSSSGTNDQHWGSQNTGYLFRLLLFIKEKAAERGVKVIELPDPPREGPLDDPVNKFFATRTLLRKAIEGGAIITMPTTFTRKGFCFKQ